MPCVRARHDRTRGIRGLIFLGYTNNAAATRRRVSGCGPLYAGGPKPTLTDLTIEAMGFAGYLAAQFPCGIFKDAILFSFVTHLFSQLAVHTFASKFHDRTTTAHHATGTIAYGRFGISAVVNQLHANQPFDDPRPRSPRRTPLASNRSRNAPDARGAASSNAMQPSRQSVQIIGIFDNGSVSPPSRKTSRTVSTEHAARQWACLDATGLRRKNASALIMFRPLAVPALVRVVLAAGAAAALLSLATSAAAAFADGGRCCGFAIFPRTDRRNRSDRTRP